MADLSKLVRAHGEEMYFSRVRPFVELNGPVMVRVVATGRAPCSECGGAFVWTLDADSTGASFGNDFLHVPDCRKLFCKHGKPWADACDGCDAESGDADSEEL